MFHHRPDTPAEPRRHSRRVQAREAADVAARAAAVLRAQRRLAQVGAPTGDIPAARTEPPTDPFGLPRVFDEPATGPLTRNGTVRTGHLAPQGPNPAPSPE